MGMEDDGNCQFRAISKELYGTQRYHSGVRAQIIQYLRNHESEYKVFFEDAEWHNYLDTMKKEKTWGDELTLRVAAECFGVYIHLVTSTEENWLLHYSPSGEVDPNVRQ